MWNRNMCESLLFVRWMNKEEKKSTHFDRYCVYEKRVPRTNKFFSIPRRFMLYACIYVDVGMMSKDLRWWTAQVEAAPPHIARENGDLMTVNVVALTRCARRPRMEPTRTTLGSLCAFQEKGLLRRTESPHKTAMMVRQRRKKKNKEGTEQQSRVNRSKPEGLETLAEVQWQASRWREFAWTALLTDSFSQCRVCRSSERAETRCLKSSSTEERSRSL